MICSLGRTSPIATLRTICRACVLKRSQYFYQTLGKPLVICSNLVCLLCFQKIHSNSINTQSLWLLAHTVPLQLPTSCRSSKKSHQSLPHAPHLWDPCALLFPTTMNIPQKVVFHTHTQTHTASFPPFFWSLINSEHTAEWVSPLCVPTWPLLAVRLHLLHF